MFTGRLSWRELLGLVRWLPPGSALSRQLDPDGWLWGMQEQLLAALVDAVNGGNWQRGGGKGTRPKPVPRPGVGADRKRWGSESRTPAEMRARLREKWGMSDDEEVG